MPKADSPTRLCEEDGCGRPYRARGRCIAHYNALYRTPNPTITVPCAWCGKPCEKAPTTRWARRFCGWACRTEWRRTAGDLLIPEACLAAGRAANQTPRAKAKRRLRQAARGTKGQTWAAGTCEDCASPFVAPVHGDLPKYCSDLCQKRTARRRRRAREHDAFGDYTWAQFMALFLRFHRRCAYCTEPVVGQPDPDHVIPLSRGGHNTIGNILPACKACNGEKSAMLLREWDEYRLSHCLPPRVTRWSVYDRRYVHLTAQHAA